MGAIPQHEPTQHRHLRLVAPAALDPTRAGWGEQTPDEVADERWRADLRALLELVGREMVAAKADGRWESMKKPYHQRAHLALKERRRREARQRRRDG